MKLSDIKTETILDAIESEFKPYGLYEPYHKQFFEYNLSDFGLPSAEELLVATLRIENHLGRLQGWRKQGTVSETYKGFSLTYNPELGCDAFSTWGDLRLSQSFSRTLGTGGIEKMRNSYYDTYAFNALHPLVAKYYGPLLGRFAIQLTRSRTAYIIPANDEIFNYGYHKDEFPFQNLRVNIPLQSSPEYVLEINGTDEHGRTLVHEQHLEVGKMYVWNTRIPHRVYAKSPPSTVAPRIHMVLGFMPWFNIVDGEVTKNEFFGINPFKLLEDGRIFK
jgi:hypothetical protein